LQFIETKKRIDIRIRINYFQEKYKRHKSNLKETSLHNLKYLEEKMVDFNLTREQVAIQKSVREFAKKEVKTIAMERDQMADHENIFPVEALKKSFEIGLHDLVIPQKYGGQGIDGLTACLVWEELAAADAGFCLAFQANFLACEMIDQQGTEAQKEIFYNALTSEGGGLAALAATEPGVGPGQAFLDDQYTLGTTLEPDGEDYILNGTKVFCTNGGSPLTKWYAVAAMKPGGVGMTEIIPCLVWAGTEGLSVPMSENKMGQRLSKTAQVYFDNVRIPKENVMEPFDLANLLNKTIKINSFVLMGALCVGMARSAYEEAFDYAQKRMIHGEPAIKQQLVAAKIADMYWNIEAVRAYVWMAARDVELNSDRMPNLKLAMGAKVLGSDLVNRVTDEALQIHGGYGYNKGTLVEKLYRDAKITQIYEVPNELLKVISANMMAMGM
jgi:alkylation response protein AidB-like acyl-CoA dehydrogenase